MTFFYIAISIVFLDLFTWLEIRTVFPFFSFRRRRGLTIFLIIQIIFSLSVVIGGYFLKDRTRDFRLFAIYYYLFGVMLALYLPKIIFILSLILDAFAARIYTMRRRLRHLSFRKPRHRTAKFGLALGLFFMGLVIWGILIGRYRYTVERVDIAFRDLPVAFDGFRIVQFSDVHAGSFAGSTHRLEKAVALINGQNPDMIVFTGDMVNNFAEEAYPLVPVFSQLSARYGKFAVLGNHDYGRYYDWKTPADKESNLNELKRVIAQMGFELLNNQAKQIDKDSLNKIAVIGAENWGYAPQPQHGDIDKAVFSVQNVPFKFLLSHDPSFWVEQILGKTGIDLTLSGHTHGMQMGIRLGKTQYSPASLRYKYWAGLYREQNQYLYVNRGLGVIGFPGRIGMLPEITVIDLKKAY